ncbi:MAG: hypothetical protein CL424_10865 [Acidimicrobiaceae bacterium]|nr:hypothetical protein [Acidimicrobiaceae bacterium]
MGGDHDRLHHRHLDSEGRRPGPRAGVRVGNLEVDGLEDLQGHRRGSRRVPHPSARPSGDALRVPRRHLQHQGLQAASHRWPRRVVATAVTIDGNREVLGLDVGDSEDEVFQTAFLHTLRDRGLDGVRLVISDAHSGLKASIARVFSGATWQRCKVHLARNILATVSHAHKDMVAATAHTIHV